MDDIVEDLLEEIRKSLSNMEATLDSIDSGIDAILRQIQMKS